MSTGLTQNVLLKANISRPADNTAYAAGDAISNSATQSAVVPLTFLLPPPTSSGILTGCRCVVAPASSNVVITALDFNLLVFAPVTNIPFAAGSYPADNTALAVTAAAMRELIATFTFANAAWLNPSGGVTAGVAGTQAVASAIASARFNVAPGASLLGILQATGSWNPLGVVNRFDFALNATLD